MIERFESLWAEACFRYFVIKEESGDNYGL